MAQGGEQTIVLGRDDHDFHITAFAEALNEIRDACQDAADFTSSMWMLNEEAHGWLGAP